MHSETQQRKLDYLAERLHHSVFDKADSLLVVGSYAHSRDFAIKNTTDLDAIILCDNNQIEGILRTECYNGYSVNLDEAMRHLEIGDTQLMSTRHSFNDCLFTMHFMTSGIFSDLFANSGEKRLFSFRKVRKEYTYEFRGFNGKGIEMVVENYPVSDGFLVPMDTCLIKEGKYFSGSPHNKLLSSPLIYFDKTQKVSDKIIRLKLGLIDRMIHEFGPNRNNEVSLINTLVRKEKIHPTILRLLAEQEKLLLSRII